MTPMRGWSTAAWVMTLALVRDRAALAMSFLLPPILFLAFAAILAGTTGKDLKLKIGLDDQAKTIDSARLVTALKAEPAFRVVDLKASGADAAEMVRLGFVDVALVIRSKLEGRTVPPLLVLESPSRPLAGVVAIGQTQRTLNDKLPDVVLARILADIEAAGAIDETDRAVLDQAFREEAAKRSGGGFSFARLIDREVVGAAAARNGNVLYYAAAVSAVFVLFGAVQGAIAMVDERANGITQRLVVGAGGLATDITGKFLFLTAQGLVQIGSFTPRLTRSTARRSRRAEYQAGYWPPWRRRRPRRASPCASARSAAAGSRRKP